MNQHASMNKEREKDRFFEDGRVFPPLWEHHAMKNFIPHVREHADCAAESGWESQYRTRQGSRVFNASRTPRPKSTNESSGLLSAQYAIPYRIFTIIRIGRTRILSTCLIRTLLHEHYRAKLRLTHPIGRVTRLCKHSSPDTGTGNDRRCVSIATFET